MQARRRSALYDADLQLRLKLGQVEAELTGPAAELHQLVFVHRDVVMGLNDVIKAKGGRKVEQLRNMKEFKKGIYLLEWENTECDMQVRERKGRFIRCAAYTRRFVHRVRHAGAGIERCTNGARCAAMGHLVLAAWRCHAHRQC